MALPMTKVGPRRPEVTSPIISFPIAFWWFLIALPLLMDSAAAKSLQSCPTLCDPLDGSPPGSPVPGILQTRTLEWVAPFLLQCVKVKSESEVAWSCPALSDPMDHSPPGSHGPHPTRLPRPWDSPGKSTEWGATAFSTWWTLHCC